MITRRGWWAFGGSSLALLLALFTLNPIVLLAGLVPLVFLGAEVVAFQRTARSLRVDSFPAVRSETRPRVACRSDLVSAVEVSSTALTGFWAELTDVAPDAFRIRAGSRRIESWFPAGGTLGVAYAFRPTTRGAHVLGPTVLSVRDALGLARVTMTLPTARAITVLPSEVAYLPSSVGRTLFSRLPGRRTYRRRGYGSDFRSLRPYQSSDDIRHVAWKRSTLTQLYVREFEHESRQDYILLLDLTPTMHAGLRGESALDRAVEAAILTAETVVKEGDDRIGLLTYTGGVLQYLPPGRGPRHLQRVVDNVALADVHPGAFDLGDAIGQLTDRLRIHAHVLAFTAVPNVGSSFGSEVSRFTASGHRLYLFVPRLEAFYPALDTPLARDTLPWFAEEETERRNAALERVREEGLPTFLYDRRGALAQVMSTYQTIHAMENAR